MNRETEERPRRGPRRERHDYSYTPFGTASRYDQDENEWWLDRELSLIENLLRERGEMKRRDIGDVLGCKYWGPRRFARALKAGVAEGRFRRVRRGVYGPA
jgi:hypothetical protein